MSGGMEDAAKEFGEVLYVTKTQTQTDVLTEAGAVVNGDRQHAYGHPKDNHGCTADLWSAWLKRKYGVDIALTAEDVCWLHILEKASRDANRPKRDNLVDVAGYARNVEMIRG